MKKYGVEKIKDLICSDLFLIRDVLTFVYFITLCLHRLFRKKFESKIYVEYLK